MSKLRIRPVNERIIVKPKAIENQTKGGILIPGTVRDRIDKEKPEVGYIMAIDKTSKEPKFLVGQKIVFNKFATTEITCQGQKYLIMLESSVLGIFTEISEDEQKQIEDDFNEKADNEEVRLKKEFSSTGVPVI